MMTLYACTPGVTDEDRRKQLVDDWDEDYSGPLADADLTLVGIASEWNAPGILVVPCSDLPDGIAVTISTSEALEAFLTEANVYQLHMWLTIKGFKNKETPVASDGSSLSSSP